MSRTRLVLIRHGQTEWSRTGQHTGRTDIELTDHGRSEAELARRTLVGWDLARVVSSPLRRALETAEIVGLPPEIEIDPDLQEWDYGEWEGTKTPDNRETDPDWSIWTTGISDGESVDEVGARADLAIARWSEAVPDGDVAVFAHGHYLTILIARWCGLPAIEGRRFKLDTATVSLVDHHRELRVLRTLNHRCGDVLVAAGR